MSDSSRFDAAYYQRHYLDPDTRTMSPEEFHRLGDFVCHYLRYLEQPVERVLDIGCGMGYWREVLGAYFPQATYTGVEVSEYLCESFGWEHASVVDYRAPSPFDLVICNDVLQYLSAAEADTAIENLHALCRGVLYFGVLTREDWAENCDRSRTDAKAYLRTGRWYRKRLARHFHNIGGGLFASHQAGLVLFDLEKL